MTNETPPGLHLACILEQPDHKPGDPPPDGYLAWHAWAEVQQKGGLRQKQCGRCGLWRYPQELSDEKLRWEARTKSGNPVQQTAPVCLQCKQMANKTPSQPIS